MVFAPTRDLSPQAHEPAAAPRRLERFTPQLPSDGSHRLHWRAVVHARDRDAVQTTWHLAGCAAPLEVAGHCPEGQQLMESVGDPDGHCLVDGKCGRCGWVAEAEPQQEVAS